MLDASEQDVGNAGKLIASAAAQPAPGLIAPSPSQQRAIESPPGPLLVLAGPGAGKTFCLTERIGYLIERHGFTPSRICAFTFTNKAADEIAHRLSARLGATAETIKRGTIHAFCAELLREFGTLVGLQQGFGIADEEYQLNVLRRIEGPRRWHRGTLTRFSAHRFRGDELYRNDAALFERYRRFLDDRGVVDFDSLVIKAAELLEQTDVADEIRARWDVVLVDEFQDLNPVQYGVIKSLARTHRHVFAVGDDDQSIYAWAGADPTVFRHFVNDFGIKEPISLDENRRCPRSVFALARQLVMVNEPIFADRAAALANRESPFPVRAHWFESDDDEAAWVVEDIRRDRELHGHAWGDVALLYRRHDIGDRLESACLSGNVPCRLVHGRALADDPVAGYVIAATRVIAAPRDDLHREAYFRVVLPRSLFDEAQAKAEETRALEEQTGTATGSSLWRQLNRMAAQLPRADENGRTIHRALANCKNLEAVGRQHGSLLALVQELLSRRVGRGRSILDEHHDEITDPATLPDVVALAGRLRDARARRAVVRVPAMGGAGIAIVGMLTAIGVTATRDPEPNSEDVESLSPDDVPSTGLPLGVFKAAQLIEMAAATPAFMDFTAIDLETTDRDVGIAEIVEIAAVRVRDGKIVAELSSLVRPSVRMNAAASAVHGISDADVADAPTFADVWPRFREFCGQDVLVAHNGYDFDFPILSRMVAATGSSFDACTFDSLPLARDQIGTSRKLADLAAGFGIEIGTAHRAADDTRALAQVLPKLEALKLARARKTALSDLLGHLGIALGLSDAESLNVESRLFLEKITPVYALGKYGGVLEWYDDQRGDDDSLPTKAQLIQALGGVTRMERIRTEKTAEQRYPASMMRLRRLINSLPDGTFEEQVAAFLERAVLSRFDDHQPEHERVNLLTLHSTKGLEFSRVYVIGAEDSQLPGGSPTSGPKAHEIQEARRLLYVGMTRTIDRLVLTYCAKRGDKASGGHQFLDEMGLKPEAPE
ncbi:MAG: UvrD-helicase domain-containing protein [Gemmatimonadetes bacterium]|nr:UvrD-helicase domain-containing protein [Gemmatimonadota bacterium]